MKIARLFKKDDSKVITPKESSTLNKIVTSEEISISTQVCKSYFVDKMINLRTHKDYEKSTLIELAYNDKDKNFVLTQLLTI